MCVCVCVFVGVLMRWMREAEWKRPGGVKERASDDKRYGLEFLSRVTSTQTQNVKLNSLMRARSCPPFPPPVPSLLARCGAS